MTIRIKKRIAHSFREFAAGFHDLKAERNYLGRQQKVYNFLFISLCINAFTETEYNRIR